MPWSNDDFLYCGSYTFLHEWLWALVVYVESLIKLPTEIVWFALGHLKEITMSFLEQTHLEAKSYHTRLRRTNAIHTGMLAGSFFLVPREVSQPSVCDGNQFRVAPDNGDNFPLQRGVLPL